MAASPGRFGVLAGATGPITTLECYDLPLPFRQHPHYTAPIGVADPFAPCNFADNNPADGVTGVHAGAYPARTDIGASVNAAVSLQLDCLPNGTGGVSGGHVMTYLLPSACSNYEPGDPQWNGKRVRTDLQFPNTSGSSVNGLSVNYQHVYPDYNTVATSASTAPWYHWNNPLSVSPLWPAWLQDFTLNNTTLGGVLVGWVTQPKAGAGSVGCATGPHLHMEVGSGEWNRSLWWGKATTAKYSDIAYVLASGIVGTAPTDR